MQANKVCSRWCFMGNGFYCLWTMGVDTIGQLIYKQFACGEQFAVLRIEGEQVHTRNGQETAVPIVGGTCQGLSGQDFARRVLDSQYKGRFLWQGYAQCVLSVCRIGRKADSAISVVGEALIVFTVAVIFTILNVTRVIIPFAVVLLCLVAVGCLVVCSQE